MRASSSLMTPKIVNSLPSDRGFYVQITHLGYRDTRYQINGARKCGPAQTPQAAEAESEAPIP